MRWLGCLALAACYSPTIDEAVPCGDGLACPSGQHCFGGLCYATPPADAPIDLAIDAPPDAAFVCNGVQSQLGSPCVGTFSRQGFWFDVEAKQPIGITGFSTMSQGGGTRAVSIYYRIGSHVGVETTPGAWQLLGSTNGFAPDSGAACPLPVTRIPITFCVHLAAGQRAAFYIVTTSGAGTFEGVDMTLGTVVTETADLRLYAGRQQLGVGAFAGTEVTDNKSFQGVIHTAL